MKTLSVWQQRNATATESKSSRLAATTAHTPSSSRKRFQRITDGLATEDRHREELRKPASCAPVDIASLKISYESQSFAMRVNGNSMEDAHILDRDIVLTEIREPREGDIVAVLLHGELLLKRYVILDECAYFKTENATCPGLLPADGRAIQGVVVALMRSLG